MNPFIRVARIAIAVVALEPFSLVRSVVHAQTSSRSRQKPLPSLYEEVRTALAGPASAQQQTPADWIEPFPPFRIADNLYYVGSKGLANYLITTLQGQALQAR